MKKKVISMMLCVTMAAGVLTACGSSETVSDNSAVTDSSDASEEGTTEEGTEESDSEEVKEVLVLGTNAEFPPYEYYENQDIVGIDVDMAKAIAEKIGVEVKVEDMQFDSIIPALTSGKIDIGMAGITVSEDRMAFVNFSDSYTTATQVIIVTEGSEIASEDDLAGKKIGVQQGTTGDIFATDLEDKGSVVERYNKGMEAVQALSQGKIDAVIIDNNPAKVFVSEVEGLQILEEAFAVEEYAIAIAKDNDELLEKVNAALAELSADGTIEEIVSKYITAE